MLAGCAGVLGVCVGLFMVNLRDSQLTSAHAAVIGLNALQIAAQVGRLDLAWPTYVQRIFGALLCVVL